MTKLIILLLGLSTSFLAAFANAQSPPVQSETFTVDFGDFQSQAELTHPTSEAPLPTVILIHGSSPMDMDATVYAFGPNGPEKLSSIFKTISDELTSAGFAVLRYNKHYVTGPDEADYDKFYNSLDLQQMLADAEAVLEVAKQNSTVDEEHIYLYGWSEGSTVAAALVAQHPELAGLILQTPVTQPWRDVFSYQTLEVGMPYLRSFAKDGKITTQTLQAALAGSGGLVAKSIVYTLADPTFFQTGELKINSQFDTNADGVIDLETEATPEILLANLDTTLQQGPLAIYAPNRALPSTTKQAEAGKLELPALMLQGTNDANVPPEGAETLAEALRAAGNTDVTLKMYEGLGHSLGKVSSAIEDNFQAMAEAPLQDVVTWLEAQKRQ